MSRCRIYGGGALERRRVENWSREGGAGLGREEAWQEGEGRREGEVREEGEQGREG